MCFVTQHMVKVFQFPGEMVCVWEFQPHKSNCIYFLRHASLFWKWNETNSSSIIFSALKEKKKDQVLVED